MLLMLLDLKEIRNSTRKWQSRTLGTLILAIEARKQHILAVDAVVTGLPQGIDIILDAGHELEADATSGSIISKVRSNL